MKKEKETKEAGATLPVTTYDGQDEEDASARFLESKDCVKIVPPEQEITSTLPFMKWSFCYYPGTAMPVLTGEKAVPYRLPGKMYGNIEARCRKVMKTFLDGTTSMGVMAAGMKGTGKSLLNKSVSNACMDLQIPIVKWDRVMDYGLSDQISLLGRHKGRLMVELDEFEKVFREAWMQEMFLSFMDGTIDAQILFFVTVNDMSRVNENMFNRLGRIRYKWIYRGLTPAETAEVVRGSLYDASLIPDTLEYLNSLPDVTYDVVTKVVDEMNIHGLGVMDAVADLNIGEARTMGFGSR